MNNILKKAAILCAVSFAGIFWVSSASSLYERGASNTSFGIVGHVAGTYEVKLYTDYNGSAWSTYSTINVTEGNTITSATNPTKSGYTFQGWRTSAPTSESYTQTYTTAQLNAIVPVGNMTFYPVFESTAEVAYSGSTYYDLNTDITINSSTLGAISIGYKYLGVSGIPAASATSSGTKNLTTTSGIYQIKKESSSAKLYRKISFRVSDSGHWNSNNNEYYSTYYFDKNSDDSSAGSDGWSSVATRSNGKVSPYTCDFYIPYNYQKIIFVRHSSAEASWDNKCNQSGDILLANNPAYNSETEKASYSASTPVLDKNQNWDITWTGKWIAA